MDREDSDRLVRIEAWQANFDAKWEENILPRLNDHGRRIGVLERAIALGTGAIAIVGGVLGYLKLNVKISQ